MGWTVLLADDHAIEWGRGWRRVIRGLAKHDSKVRALAVTERVNQPTVAKEVIQ